jgi:hypothetical protein
MLGNMPAYPHPGEAMDADYYQNYGYAGMTIRQRYAMAAMQGFISDGNIAVRDNEDNIANHAFKLADAMIEFEEKEYEEKRKAAETKKAEEKS